MYKAEILRDSINPHDVRLTTMRVNMPRFVLAEFNTHRVFSRNAGSSRAISVKRRIEQVENNPVFPLVWGKEQKGMQANARLDDTNLIMDANCAWKDAASYAVQQAKVLMELGVHKQIVNRLLEPFVWVQVIVSSTEWDNFFDLRISPMAQPEICRVAEEMRNALVNSRPAFVQWGDWHIPLADDKDVAVGRLARVSYETNPKTEEEDRALAKQLAQSGHWSPFEHVARAAYGEKRNFDSSWTQYRSMLD